MKIIYAINRMLFMWVTHISIDYLQPSHVIMYNSHINNEFLIDIPIHRVNELLLFYINRE